MSAPWRLAAGRPASGCGAALPLVGKGRADACSLALMSAGVSAGCADSIRPAAAATSGDEKLVPWYTTKASV